MQITRTLSTTIQDLSLFDAVLAIRNALRLKNQPEEEKHEKSCFNDHHREHTITYPILKDHTLDYSIKISEEDKRTEEGMTGKKDLILLNKKRIIFQSQTCYTQLFCSDVHDFYGLGEGNFLRLYDDHDPIGRYYFEKVHDIRRQRENQEGPLRIYFALYEASGAKCNNKRSEITSIKPELDSKKPYVHSKGIVTITEVLEINQENMPKIQELSKEVLDQYKGENNGTN